MIAPRSIATAPARLLRLGPEPKLWALALAGVLLLTAGGSVQASEKTTQIDILFDASGSMKGKIDKQAKIDIAREALNNIVNDLKDKPGVRVGLRVYGHLNNKCDNSVLELPIGPLDAAALQAKVASLKPKGKTPIGYSLQQAVADFDASLPGDRVIFLITDGLESCKADPCATARALAKAGIVSRIHIVGFGLGQKELAALRCIAAPSGGSVLGAADAGELTRAFTAIVMRTFNDNLILVAKNDQNQPTLADFAVFPAGQNETAVAKGDTSLNQQGTASLAPGRYDLKLTHGSTGDVLWVRGVEIPEDGQVKREVVFAQRELKIKLQDPSGSFRFASVYLHDKAGNELKSADTSMGNTAQFSILPGVYDVKIEDYQTKKILWLRDVDLSEAKALEKIVPFK